MNYEHLKLADPELYASMERELGRQRDHLELIASENFTSPAVMEAVGSHLTNKYAEGYPGARYYGGCDYVDEVERLAIARVTRLTPTFSRTPARRRIWPCMRRCCSRATASSA